MHGTFNGCENLKKLPLQLFIIVMVQVDYDSPHLPGPSNGNNQAKDP
jgi:hypothetical protein